MGLSPAKLVEVGSDNDAVLTQTPVLCLHCQSRQKVQGLRGLCRICFDDLDVRACYPSVHDLAQLSPPLPPESTDALPGSWAKIEVMRQRVADGYQPHHPDDPKYDWGCGNWDELWYAIESWQNDVYDQ